MDWAHKALNPQLLQFTCYLLKIISNYWPAFPDDPQTTGDKVASVFELFSA